MGGLNIMCGTFQGTDKSGTPIIEVLKELRDLPADVIFKIESAFEAEEYALIPQSDAKLLLPSLHLYRSYLEADLLREDAEQNTTITPKTRRKFSREWLLGCAIDLIDACETSLREHQPVVILFA